MAALLPVIASVCLGPVYTKQSKRDEYAHVQSETLSLTDRVFQDTSSKQLVDFKKHAWQPDNVRLTDYIYNNPLPIQAPLEPRAVIHEYRKMMKEHVERRVLFFFQQAIVCYQTKLHFESLGAQDQADSADAIAVSNQGEHAKYSVRNAAHSSGNPCIVAYDLAAWNAFKEKGENKPQGFVFLKGTDYYRTANSTMNMPRWMNEADREIDEKTNNSLLREKGNALINKCALGELTPDQCMVEYIKVVLFEVRAAKGRLVAAQKDQEEQLVLSYYEKYLLKLQAIIASDPLFLEKFLGIMQGNGNHNETSKRIIYQMRYASIRNCQINQAALIQKIEGVRQQILAQYGRKPDNFKAAFNMIVIEQARTDEDRMRLEKLLNFSPVNFLAQLKGGAKTKFESTKTLLSAHAQQINFIALDVLQDMRRLRTEEMYGRSQVVKTLRGMKQWTQKKLGAEIKQQFPQAAASQPTISRIENRGKLVTSQIAQEFSRVFGVDSGLFMPHFFYE